MYVVTFYSFKGGVGRSMSLVNVGVQLAQSGRKVLLVDFDLEAPGLPTFSLKKPKEDQSGVLEYVSQYIATGESPDVKDFFYESEKYDSGGSLFVMPAGKQDVSYSHRLNLIDWRKLYSEQSGYLFFEDLRRQWDERISPDYVLIDSRTGHSDVEGICTRQLPNAVCLLFFPNEQNLHGLKRIVANIKLDNEKSQSKKIKMHFVVSNIPDLDDEDQILRKTLLKFKRELGYKKLAAEIHHYNSLSLLNQQIFSMARPNSRLTKEYNVLTKEITKHNLGDREVAIAFLKSAHRDLQDVMDDAGPTKLEDQIQNILKTFPDDGEIRFRAALVFEQLGSSQDALSMLSSDWMEEHYGTATMYAARARLNHRLGDPKDAVRDLKAMLVADEAEFEAFLDVVPLIDQLNPELLDLIPYSKAFQSLSAREKMFLAFQFEGNEKQLGASAVIAKQLIDEKNEFSVENKDVLSHQLAMASIGTGDFDTAIEILKPENQVESSLGIVDAFNLAMAMWGRNRTPPIDLFNVVVKRDDESTADDNQGPNYLQCLAITHAALRNNEKAKFFLEGAKESIADISSRVFSAWTYSKVPPQLFLTHLEEIKKFINGEEILPRFIGERIKH